MSTPNIIEPLTGVAFAPFGDELECTGDPDKMINQGLCGRFHDRAALDFSDGRAGISLFDAEPRSLPLRLETVERHPEGSQDFFANDGRAISGDCRTSKRWKTRTAALFSNEWCARCELFPRVVARGFATTRSTWAVCRRGSDRGRF